MKLDKTFIGTMLGCMGLQVGFTLLDRYLSEEKHEFPETLVQRMVDAAEANNLKLFSEVYKSKRPSASRAEVLEKFEKFKRIIAEG